MTIEDLKKLVGKPMQYWTFRFLAPQPIGANLKDAEVGNGTILASLHGTGVTKEAAANDYLRKLIADGKRGNRLVVDAYTKERREFVWCAIREKFVPPEHSRITEE